MKHRGYFPHYKKCMGLLMNNTKATAVGLGSLNLAGVWGKRCLQAFNCSGKSLFCFAEHLETIAHSHLEVF